MGNGGRNNVSYNKPQIRTFDAKTLMESLGPASAMASGELSTTQPAVPRFDSHIDYCSTRK